jgi:glycosyltransferase involved in cell wall biosynthesis
VSLDVVALVPALNESATIGAVVAGVRAHVRSVLVVDDGSADATAAAAAAAGAVVIAHGQTMGKGQALRTGFRHLLKSATPDYILMLDGDLQHRPDEAAKFIAAAQTTTADLVVGERQFERETMPASRYYANLYGSAALSSFTGVPLRDTQCGYRLLRTAMLKRLRLRATGYDIETEMLIKVSRLGGRITSVPISAVYGSGRSKLRPVRDTTRTCFRAVFYRYIERLS